MDKRLLTNRNWFTDGNWYSPKNFIKSFKSVKRVVLWNTSSSAGDWNGYFVQTLGNKTYIIPFSQENNYPRSSGFSFGSGSVAVSYPSSIEMSEDESNSEFLEWCKINGYE